MWSIGNEIPMRFTTQGRALAVSMRDLVHALDVAGSGRAVTSAYPMLNEQDSPFLHSLDVPGCAAPTEHRPKPSALCVASVIGLPLPPCRHVDVVTRCGRRYNYAGWTNTSKDVYAIDHARLPNRTMVRTPPSCQAFLPGRGAHLSASPHAAGGWLA
jgi:hypothetical protein